MFIDGKKLDKQKLNTSLCIIGGGMAGVMMASQFIGTNTQVIVVESGDFDWDEETQQLYQGESVGLNYPLMASRLRQYGGSSNHWGGFCAPLDEIDFRARDWVPNSGWPFDKKELDPYYAKAEQFLGLDAHAPFNPNLLPLNDDLILQRWRFPNNLLVGITAHDALEKAKNIRFLLNSNVFTIDVNDNGAAVIGLDVRTLKGQRFTVQAQYYILACGGIENARLMLASNNVIKNGIGNSNDLVGRFFTEHPHIRTGIVYSFKNDKKLEAMLPSGTELFNITPSDEAMKNYKILNGSMAFTKSKPKDWSLIKESKNIIKYCERLMGPQSGKREILELFARTEQTPNPNSTVTLSHSTKDALGMPQSVLNWQLCEEDWRSIRQLTLLTAEMISAAGIGVVHINESFGDKFIGWPDFRKHGKYEKPLQHGNHHMGTTRMHNNPKQGVVDKNCRVHEMHNLYIAGSSVYPTVGWANPSFTLLALGFRLVEHLKPILT